MSIQELLSSARSYKAGQITLPEMDSAIADFKSEARKNKVRAPKYNAQVRWCLVKMGIAPKAYFSLPRPKAKKDTGSGKTDE